MAVEPDRTDAIPYGLAPDSFRLPAATRVGTVSLAVADLDRSIAYYQRVLGLHPVKRAGARATLGVGAGPTPLIELHEKRGVAPAPPGGRPGLYHFAVLLPDRPALGRFAAHLARMGEPAGSADHRVSEAFYLRDPDGLGVEVYADRPRSEWRHEKRQIEMATDPLDVQAVVRAGKGEPWRGAAPDGTAIGHIHLHVGDLDRAETFYHQSLGLDKVVWSYPGALFLSAGGYHHHLGVNTWARHSEPAGDGDARLLEWELRVPTDEDAAGALASLETAGHPVERDSDGGIARDPWGTALRITSVS